MRKGSIAVLCLTFALVVPATAEAKAYTHFDYGFGYNDGPATQRGDGYRGRQYDGRSYANRGRKQGYRQGYADAQKGRGYAQTYGYPRKSRGYAQGYGYANAPRTGFAKRAMTSASIAGLGGSSVTCLTSEARGLLSRIEAQFGKVEIVSTCRPGSTIAGTNYPSKHASGQAIDFRVPGRKGEVVNWLIANDRLGGIMTYSDMDHIHVDVGQRFVALNRPSGRT